MARVTNIELKGQLEASHDALRRSELRATTGQLALEIIHEIKNPLEALGHLIYLAREEADHANNVRKYLDMAEEQMVNLRHVAAQTLGFARSPSTMKSVDLVALSEAALRIHQRTIDTQKIHLVKHLPEHLAAEVHTAEILQVVSNLLANAVEALPEGGTLHLRLRKRGDNVHFLVADNGHGIRPEHVEAIFQPFFTTKGDRGTGLGLAVTKKIVDRHKGKIRVRSSVRPRGHGTAFRVSLPVRLKPE